MLYRILHAEAKPGYRLWIRFEDGVEGEVDLTHLVGRGVFAAWRDEARFREVFIDPETGTVAWPGDIDLAPDALHDKLVGVPSSS